MNRCICFLLICFIPIFSPVSAQSGSCPTIVNTALTATNNLCAGLGRNQICYGNLVVDAVPQPTAVGFKLNAPGDIANVADLQSLIMSPLNTDLNVWGVSMMKIQANLPDTLPGQNVVMVMFGNVSLQPVPIPPQINITIQGNLNVRTGPGTGYDIITNLSPDTNVTATGRSALSDWLRIWTPDGQTGWVAAQYTATNGNITSLQVADPNSAVSKPMQAFYFRSGIGDSPCQEAPDSGLLIQTPAGVGSISLTINEVNINLGSTGYVQASPGNNLSLSVIEGSGRVSAQGVDRLVPAGTKVTVPLSIDLKPIGPPSEVEAYQLQDLQGLPLNLLERPIEIHYPLTPEELTQTTGQLDLIFVIDTTGSMDDDIAQVVADTLDIINQVAQGGHDWQIGIVTYRDYPYAPYGDPGDYSAKVNLGFSSDYSSIVTAINSITIGGGNDTPESVYAGLMTAMSFPWRSGAQKAIILMGDAPPHDPEPETGHTLNSVLQTAFNLGGIGIYPLMIADDPDTLSSFTSLADGSSGKLFSAATAEYVIEAILDAIGSITYDTGLAKLLQPGDQIRIFSTADSVINLHQNPGLSTPIVETVANGTSAVILGGPAYQDTYIWWQIQTSTNQGWIVQAADGITTIVPLDYGDADSTFIPPTDRTITPTNARILTGGRGLTNGVLVGPGEFQVEWFCNTIGSGIGQNTIDWFCLNSDNSVNFILTIADYDNICKATYGNANAFAVQDGGTDIPAYNWRCYGP